MGYSVRRMAAAICAENLLRRHNGDVMTVLDIRQQLNELGEKPMMQLNDIAPCHNTWSDRE